MIMKKNTPSGFFSAAGSSITPQRMSEIDAWVQAEYSPEVQNAVRVFINYIDPQVAQHASIFVLKSKLDEAIAKYKSDPAFKSGVDKVLKDKNISPSIMPSVVKENAQATTPGTSEQPPAPGADDKNADDSTMFDTTTIVLIAVGVIAIGGAVWYFGFRKK